MKEIKLWPHLTIVAILSAGLAMGAVMLWNKHEQTSQAATLPSAARIERVDGEVGLQRSLSDDNSDPQWIEVTQNTPISVGDRIYARENSRTGIAFTGRNFARLEPNSSLDVLSLSDRRTQVALRDGSAIFNVGELEPDELFEVATPQGAFDLQQPGLYEVGLNNDGSAWVSVLSGLAQVVGLAGTGQVSKGEMLTLVGQTAADIALSRLSPDYAGGLVDDYYGYQYPDLYDGRYGDYNAYLSDPYYYDPYNRYVSYRYVDDTIPGVWALDGYGDWVEVSNYGHAWRPRVDAGWAPYQQGYWMMDDPYGLTWVSSEPWGYAPYHYGRWANVGGQWYWVPERVDTRPAYSPALVAFIPPTETNAIGWVPLAPGDPYVATYYDADWQPHYLTRTPVAQERVINLNVPGAVTVVSADDFGRVIDKKALKKFDKERFARSRPVLDPLSVGELRQIALKTTNKRRRVDIPPGIARKLDDTQVFTSAKPFAPPFREGRAQKVARAEPVPEKQKKQKLQFRDERQAAQMPVQANAPDLDRKRGRQVKALEAEAARGNKEARQQVQELRRQERTEQRAARRQVVTPQPGRSAAQAASERAIRMSEQRAQGERVGLSRKAEKDATRGRAAAAEKQQRAVVRQQNEPRRQAAPQPQRVQPQSRQRPEKQARPSSKAQMSPGQLRQQPQGPAQQKGGRGQASPKSAKPEARKPAGKGKGRP
ncbi:MAG TPA: DUF6600 domain-containing protein [Pyrinomonadaceae bacterium]|jgi:hypothetical protein